MKVFNHDPRWRLKGEPEDPEIFKCLIDCIKQDSSGCDPLWAAMEMKLPEYVQSMPHDELLGNNLLYVVLLESLKMESLRKRLEQTERILWCPKRRYRR